jgi:hypothetical protein
MKLCIFTENAKQIFVFHQCAKLPFNLIQYLSKFERKTETVVDLSEAQVDSTGQTSLNKKKINGSVPLTDVCSHKSSQYLRF